MWPFSRKKSPRDHHDGYEPPQDPPAAHDPWAQPAVVAAMEQRVAERHDEAVRLDGWKNELTGVGDFLRDKSLGGRRGGLEFEVNHITNVAAEARWRGSDLGARVVETIPDEMTREGWDVEVQPSDGDDEAEVLDAFGAPVAAAAPPVPQPLDIDDEGIEIAEELDGILDALGLDQALWQALCYERAFGGGAILVGANDGMTDLSKPLDEGRIKSVDWLNVLSGGWDGEVVAWSYYQDPTKPNYGMPETYMVRNLGVPLARVPTPGEPMTQPVLPPSGATVWWVHESRLLLFSGVAVSHRARVQVRGWGDGVYTRVDEVLQQYGQTWGGIANLMTDFSQAVLSIKGLAQSIGANKSVVSSRALQINMARSISRILMIDADEVFKRDTVSLAGVAEVLQQFALRLAAASGMPLSLLMGQVQGGLGDASAGDIRYFYDRVASWQRRRMLPQLRRLIRLVFLSKEGPTGGVEPARWSVKARPLYQLSSTERAQQYLTMAQGDQIYYAMGAASAEEVAAKRFGGSEYDPGPIALDLGGRAAMSASFSEEDPSKTQSAGAGATDPSSAKVSIPPQTQAALIKVNEARAKMGLPEWGGPDGELSVNEFLAKHSGAAAQAANAQKGVVGDPQSVEEQAAAKVKQTKATFGQESESEKVVEEGGGTEDDHQDAFDPDQPRDEGGKWSAGGGKGGPIARSGGRGSSGGGGEAAERAAEISGANADPKETLASRASARAAARAAARMGPKPAEAPRSSKGLQKPEYELTETQKQIRALRVRAQVAEENRVFNGEKTEKAIRETAVAAERHPTLSGWDPKTNASTELVAHRMSPTAEGRRWSVTNWKYQTVETFKSPVEAARRFVGIVGHENAHAAIGKAQEKSEKFSRELFQEHERKQSSGFMRRVAKWFGEDSADEVLREDVDGELTLEEWIEETEHLAAESTT